MPTTIDSMTGVEIKSPFFDTVASLELFPVHPNVLKNPCALKKNRVALIYGSNGSGKSTIAQGFREYAESVVPKTVELNPTAGASIIKMSSGMKSEKIFVFDEKYISRNIKVQESGLGTIVLLGEQVELEKRLEELKAQIAKLQANIDSKAENVQQFEPTCTCPNSRPEQKSLFPKLYVQIGFKHGEPFAGKHTRSTGDEFL